MRYVKIGLVVLLTFAVAGCGNNGNPVVSAGPVTPTRTPPPTKTPDPQSVPKAEPDTTLTRTDDQGAVLVEVTPIELDDSSDVLAFRVALNTHSVDLSMDLATESMLTTDAGITVGALSWDAPRGGHHVSGTLTFPASLDGQRVLSGTTRLTLTIRDVDAAERLFVWDLSP